MMMRKEDLKNSQPVAWRILSSALQSGKVSHAYLFHGPQGAPLSQMALLFAQSLVCQHPDEDGFACQQCAACRRMANEESPDFFWLHPGGLLASGPISRKTIEQWWKSRQEEPPVSRKSREYRVRKEDVLRLQDDFATSAVEGGRQIYLLEQYEKATPEASNALLKFFEEPKDGLTGILCSHSPSGILPTILSRAQMIPFRPAGVTARSAAIESILEDEEYADMLAQAGYDDVQAAKLIEDLPIFEIRDGALAYWKERKSPMALYRLQSGLFKSKSATCTKPAVRLFLEWLLWCIRQEKNEQSASLLSLRLQLLECLDNLSRPVDLSLMVDRIGWSVLQQSRRAAW